MLSLIIGSPFTPTPMLIKAYGRSF